jgi:hypothetical protein
LIVRGSSSLRPKREDEGTSVHNVITENAYTKFVFAFEKM